MDPIVILPIGLQYTNSEGDLVTQLYLSQYNQLIGNAIVDLQEITETLELDDEDLNARVTVLEDTQITVDPIPEISAPGVMPDSELYPLDQILSVLSQQFVSLKDATGSEGNIIDGVDLEDPDLKDEPSLVNNQVIMSDLSGWVASPTTAGDAISNIWITLQDVRTALKNIMDVSANACDDLIIEYDVYLDAQQNYITLHFFGFSTIPAGFIDCDQQGSLVRIQDDADNEMYTRVNITNTSAQPAGTNISFNNTNINPYLNFSVTVFSCLKLGVAECTDQVVVNYTNNLNPCPVLTVVPNSPTQVSFSFNPIVNNDVIYTLEVLDDQTPVEEYTYTNPQMMISDILSGLTANTTYTFNMSIQLTGRSLVTCNPVTITTPTQ